MDGTGRAELATFLRHRRARVQPAEVGLPAGQRRRTPGLRRQEVAQLAGMSVDYYTRLEQGRGPRPSSQILTAISRALRLSDAERDYLHHLAGEPTPVASLLPREVGPGVLHLLDRLDDVPVLVCDAKYDVLDWNALGAALFGDLSAVPPADRNVIWRFFTRPEARQRHDPATAEQFARASVADLRAAAARHPRDPGIADLVRRLHGASEQFRRLWAEREVFSQRSTHKRIRHPQVGWLDLDCDALHDPERDQWVIVYTAAPGTPTHHALQLLKVLGTQQWPETSASTPTPG